MKDPCVVCHLRAHTERCLDGGTDSHGLIGIDTLRRLTTDDPLDRLNNPRQTCPSANPVDLRRLDAGVIEGFLARVDGALNTGGSERLELRSHELLVGVEVHWGRTR